MISGILKTLAGLGSSSVRRNPAGTVVRLGRVLYSGSAGFIALAMYSGYKDQKGKGQTFLSALNRGLDWRKVKGTVAVGSGSSGSGGSSDAQIWQTPDGLTPETYNENRYRKRLAAIAQAGARFGLQVASGKRTPEENAAANGVPNSMHLTSRGALAFDLSSGPGLTSPQEKRFYDWAVSKPETFQQVLLHTVDPTGQDGWHVHVVFRPGVTKIVGV